MLAIQDISNKLTFDLLTLKVVSRVTWTISVPILVFLGLSVLELCPMYAAATDRRQTDVRQKHRLMPPLWGPTHNNHHAASSTNSDDGITVCLFYRLMSNDFWKYAKFDLFGGEKCQLTPQPYCRAVVIQTTTWRRRSSFDSSVSWPNVTPVSPLPDTRWDAIMLAYSNNFQDFIRSFSMGRVSLCWVEEPDGFFRRLYRYGYTPALVNMEQLLRNADETLFCKALKDVHCLHHLQELKTPHIHLRPANHNYHLPICKYE